MLAFEMWLLKCGHEYVTDAESEGSMLLRNLWAQGCGDWSAMEVLLRAEGFLKVDPVGQSQRSFIYH